MRSSVFIALAAVAAVLLLAAPGFTTASEWTDLGHGLALQGGKVVELASVQECQQLAAAQARWAY